MPQDQPDLTELYSTILRTVKDPAATSSTSTGASVELTQGLVFDAVHNARNMPTGAPAPIEGASTFSAGRVVEKGFPVFLVPDDEE